MPLSEPKDFGTVECLNYFQENRNGNSRFKLFTVKYQTLTVFYMAGLGDSQTGLTRSSHEDLEKLAK